MLNLDTGNEIVDGYATAAAIRTGNESEFQTVMQARLLLLQRTCDGCRIVMPQRKLHNNRLRLIFRSFEREGVYWLVHLVFGYNHPTPFDPLNQQQHNHHPQQVNNLREIQALRRLSPNQHVITLEEVLYDQPTGRLALVFELMDANLYELIRGRRHYLNGQVRQEEADERIPLRFRGRKKRESC